MPKASTKNRPKNRSVSEVLQQAFALHQAGRQTEAESLYQAVLKASPNNFDALHLLGLSKYQRGIPTEALPLIAAALKTNTTSTALANYGLVLDALDRGAEALSVYEQALVLAPDDFGIFSNRAKTLQRMGRHEEALAVYETILRSQPDNFNVLCKRALALRALGRDGDALKDYDRVLSSMPGHIDAGIGKGQLLIKERQFAEALRCFGPVLAIAPTNAEALQHKAIALLALERFDEARLTCDKMLSIQADNPGGLAVRAAVMLAAHRYDEALADCDKALSLQPADFGLLRLRGNILRSAGRPAEALELYDACIEVDRSAGTLVQRATALNALGRHKEALDDANAALQLATEDAWALNQQGLALHGLGMWVEALAAYDALLDKVPDHAEAHNNKAQCLTDLRRFEDALDCYAKAITAKPNYAEAHFHEGLLRLTLGDFPEGWKKYEWRWKRRLGAQRKAVSQPLWLGQESIEGRTILLHAEQGLGDTIQFLRYVRMVQARGADVILEVQPELVSLLAGAIEGVSVKARGDTLPPFDLHCPLLSLPLALGTTLETIPPVEILTPSATRVSKWAPHIAADSIKVGLVWSGNRSHRNDRNRSIPLAELVPLLDRPGVRYFSLQRDIRPEDSEILKDTNLTDLASGFEDFADTAAAISMLDVVISVDTAVAHLAATVGKPAWILLPYTADFRWMVEREDTPWYPGAKLFRQASPGDWSGVVHQVGVELLRSA
jgi:tetratricopeptide (TPR) repeat protein